MHEESKLVNFYFKYKCINKEVISLPLSISISRSLDPSIQSSQLPARQQRRAFFLSLLKHPRLSPASRSVACPCTF